MRLVPDTMPRPPRSDVVLDLNPKVCVPGGYGLAETGAPWNFVPGSCCVEISVGSCMVGLHTRKHADPQTLQPMYDFWEAFIVPVPQGNFASFYRDSEWGKLWGFHTSEKLVRMDVVFDPSLLEFKPSQHELVPRGPYEPMDYADPALLHLYERWGLIVGRSYHVEYLYEKPYLKVEGVPLIMSAEVWRVE